VTVRCVQIVVDVPEVFDGSPVTVRDGVSIISEIEFAICRSCGCTDTEACFPGCAWIESDLCSRCVTVSIETVRPAPAYL
jgi:hypothetical protein